MTVILQGPSSRLEPPYLSALPWGVSYGAVDALKIHCASPQNDGFSMVVVRKYDIQDSSSCDLLQFIFVVKTAQYGNCRHAMVVRNVMPLVQERDLRK